MKVGISSKVEEVNRGEGGATETYEQALELLKDSTHKGVLSEIKSDHGGAICILKEIYYLDEEETQQSEPWGVFAKTMVVSARIPRDESFLKAGLHVRLAPPPNFWINAMLPGTPSR